MRYENHRKYFNISEKILPGKHYFLTIMIVLLEFNLSKNKNLCGKSKNIHTDVISMQNSAFNVLKKIVPVVK